MCTNILQMKGIIVVHSGGVVILMMRKWKEKYEHSYHPKDEINNLKAKRLSKDIDMHDILQTQTIMFEIAFIYFCIKWLHINQFLFRFLLLCFERYTLMYSIPTFHHTCQ